MSDLQRLQETDIPSGRQALRDNYSNLQNVAEYCEHNYLKATDKRRALEETMSLTSQSLASVAYQISSLTGNILSMLDLQVMELQRLEGNICCISHKVDLHKEKVSRLEIGAITTSRIFPRSQKIVSPTSREQVNYSRKPLNFTILDNIGHGLKDSSTQLSKTGTMSRKTSQKSSAQSKGSLGRSSRPPDPVHPPVVPGGRFFTASSSMLPSSGVFDGFDSTLTDMPLPPPPPNFDELPPPLPLDASPLPFMSQIFLPPPPPTALESVSPSPPTEEVPPPPPLFPVHDYQPPSPLDFTDCEVPPPPPPVHYEPEEHSWVPDCYLEKVMALYPYSQQKEDEMSFPEGTVIYVTSKDADGWYQGIANGFSGYFPGNYVRPHC